MGSTESAKALLRTVSCFAVILMMTGCVGRMVYYPDHVEYQTPENNNLSYEDVLFKSGDGTVLNGWFVPAAGQAMGTVIHFHGNAQNMSAHFSFVDWLPENGYNLFTFDYRGYGKSDGHPTRKGVYEDCVAAMNYIQTRTDIDQTKLFVLGQSLGAANAINLLGKNRLEGVQAIIADSSFFSYRSIVRDKIREIPIISFLNWPLSFLVIGNSESPGTVVDRISPVPIVFIHGTADEVIPVHHTKWLYENANPPKSIWIISEGRHMDALGKERNTYIKRLLAFFDNPAGGNNEK
ncbi:MAG: alpha/beta hydrolase [Proteobacteria bacterium]|nr:alpha/beta hydrolase [Pseudomonadota bacterium]